MWKCTIEFSKDYNSPLPQVCDFHMFTEMLKNVEAELIKLEGMNFNALWDIRSKEEG